MYSTLFIVMVLTVIVSVTSNFNVWFGSFYFNKNKNQISIICMQYPSFTKIWVRIAFYFIIPEGKFFSQQGQWPFFTVNTVDDGVFNYFFDNLITHERELLLGSLSSLDYQTPAFSFSPFGRWQVDSGPLGGLPAPKTTAATTLTNAATTTMMTTTMTITGR